MRNGERLNSSPGSPFGTGLPSSSTTRSSVRNQAWPTEPGLVCWSTGRRLVMIPPSVEPYSSWMPHCGNSDITHCLSGHGSAAALK